MLEPDATELALTVTRDCARDTAPGMTVIVGELVVTGELLIVALIEVGVPDKAAEKTAV